MCTAVTYKTKDFYFGRTLDWEFLYESEVTVAPRNFPFKFRFSDTLESHYAIIGMSHVAEGYPLYYDGVNEKGLSMAGLNFVGNAVYRKSADSLDNIAQFEFIPRILGRCASVAEARELIKNINITDTPFSDNLPVAELHWLIADSKEAITVEVVKEGIRVHDNSVGVLTNNPPFPQQMFNLSNYMQLSPKPAVNRFFEKLTLREYSRGMGALGLPGDFSSQSRFVRAAFVKLNSVSGESEAESVNQFFHILGAVNVPQGCCRAGEGESEKTLYTCCMNASRGIYYYNTYESHGITAVDMHKEDLLGDTLVRYPLAVQERILRQN